MRRIIHNTTAIAACLSILAPQFAQAQLVGTAAGAGQPASPAPLVLAQAEQTEGDVPPVPLPEPVEEGATDAAPAEAEPEAAAEEPAAEEPAAEEPAAEEAVPVETPVEAMTEDEAAPEAAPAEAAEEAPAEEAPAEEAAPAEAEATEEPAAAEEPAAEAPAAEAPAEEAPAAEPIEESTPPAAAPREGDAPRPEGAEGARQENVGDTRPEAPAREQEQARPPAAEQPDATAPAARPEPADDAATTGEAAPEAGADPLRDALEQEAATTAEEPTEDAAATAEPQAEPAAPDTALSLSETVAQPEGMTNISKVLSSELDGGLKASDLRCASGAAYPCAAGDPLVTPKGVVVQMDQQGQVQLAPRETQMFRATENGEMVARAAEEGTRETESAQQAAQETGATTDAAALNDDDSSGAVTEEQITEDNNRSSAEDFTTSLRQALQPTAENQPRSDDDDDDNKLTKALLLGAGALAVGAMLNNNRQVALSAPDRVVVTRADGSQEVIKDEVALLRQPGSTVTTENFDDGSSRTIVTRADGSKVVTIRDADLRVLRRTLVSADGQSTRLIDDTETVDPVDIASLPQPAPVASANASLDEAALREALLREAGVDRQFTLGQIRNIPEVRALVAPVNIDAITFDTGSAAINPDQARQLSTLGRVIQDAVAQNPREIFLIEGHTDTVGSEAANLALSDRRAESVALALSEYFDVPPENLVVQGYGEQFLMVRAEGDIRENRRASVRRITDLLHTAQAE